MTVAELLTGQARPLGGVEFVGWSALYQLEAAEREKEAAKLRRRRR